MKDYVAGFMFNPSGRQVVLIKKLRPAWQAGRFNAVGGRIEEKKLPSGATVKESPAEAMSREFFEETNVLYPPEGWRQFCDLLCPNGDRVYFLVARADLLYAAVTKTDEQVVTVIVSSILQESDCLSQHDLAPNGYGSTETKPMYNLPWLVHMALEALQTGYHYIVEERRPKS
jgi:ADP-ribose pyrophosphatase YjhB (NUDIX family)